eukprot:gene14270-10201_t
MRIAVCLWGLLRSLRHTINSFEEHILSALDQYEASYDIYVHTYNISGAYQSARNHEKSVTLNVSEWQLLKPNYIFIENQEEFDARINYPLFETQGDPWHNDFSSFKNHMRALNSLYHVTQVVEQMHQQQPYDAIVFLRPDVRFLTDLPLQLLHHPPTMRAYDLFLPDFHRSCWGNEFNDRMALGKVAAALIYGKKFEAAFMYSLAHKLHAEKITYHQLSRTHTVNTTTTTTATATATATATKTTMQVRVAEIPFRFQRIRSSGEIHVRDYEAVTPQVQSKLEARGEYFVGKGRRTPWLMRMLYTLMEIVTLGQVYIWNHDDHGNVFCRPHDHLDESLLQQLRKQYTTATAVKPTTPSSPPMSRPMRRKPGRARIDCAYQVVPYAFTSDHSPIAAKYIQAAGCHYVVPSSSSETWTGPSFLGRTATVATAAEDGDGDGNGATMSPSSSSAAAV